MKSSALFLVPVRLILVLASSPAEPNLPIKPYASSPITAKSINANNEFAQQGLVAVLRTLKIRSSAAAVVDLLAKLFRLKANGITTTIWSRRLRLLALQLLLQGQ